MIKKTKMILALIELIEVMFIHQQSLKKQMIIQKFQQL